MQALARISQLAMKMNINLQFKQFVIEDQQQFLSLTQVADLDQLQFQIFWKRGSDLYDSQKYELIKNQLITNLSDSFQKQSTFYSQKQQWQTKQCEFYVKFFQNGTKKVKFTSKMKKLNMAVFVNQKSEELQSIELENGLILKYMINIVQAVGQNHQNSQEDIFLNQNEENSKTDDNLIENIRKEKEQLQEANDYYQNVMSQKIIILDNQLDKLKKDNSNLKSENLKLKKQLCYMSELLTQEYENNEVQNIVEKELFIEIDRLNEHMETQKQRLNSFNLEQLQNLKQDLFSKFEEQKERFEKKIQGMESELYEMGSLLTIKNQMIEQLEQTKQKQILQIEQMYEEIDQLMPRMTFLRNSQIFNSQDQNENEQELPIFSKIRSLVNYQNLPKENVEQLEKIFQEIKQNQDNDKNQNTGQQQDQNLQFETDFDIYGY